MTKSALFAKRSVILTHFCVISRHFIKRALFWRFRTLPWNSKLNSGFQVAMEFTSRPEGHNLCGKLLVLWSDYSRGENTYQIILCFKNQGWSFSSFSSKVFDSDHELDLKGWKVFHIFFYCLTGLNIEGWD